MSVSNADDITVTSSNQNKELHVNYSTPTSKDPPEGKTTAVIAVMSVKPATTTAAVTSTTNGH